MNIREAVMQIPESDRPAIIAEFRKTTSVEDIEALAKQHDLDIDAKAVYEKLSSVEVDEQDLKKVAGGCSCICSSTSCECGHSCGCTSTIRY